MAAWQTITGDDEKIVSRRLTGVSTRIDRVQEKNLSYKCGYEI
jgi:hypothetical protein